MLLRGSVFEDGCFPLCDIERMWKCVCLSAIVCVWFKVTSSLRLRDWHHAPADMITVTHTCSCSRMWGLNLSHSHPISLPINIWYLLDPIKRLIHRAGICSVARMTLRECICIMYETPPHTHLSVAPPPSLFTSAHIPSGTLTNLCAIRTSAYFIKVEESTASDVLSRW